jgi:hypothetical protein
MCNCGDRPAAVADPQYWDKNFRFTGLSESPRYFEQLDTTTLAPPLSFSTFLYCCTDCNQAWYIECAPEETPDPVFAMKLESMTAPSEDDVRAANEFLSVIAHGGFGVTRCTFAHCPNRRLKGRLFCHLHMPFP